MALILSDKSRMRFHLQYPTIGLAPISVNGSTLASGMVGWRFFEAYGMLEYRMNNFAPDEEARITGRAYGSVAFVGSDNVNGTTVSLTISGGGLSTPQVVSYTGNSTDNRLSFITALSIAANQNATLTAAGFNALSPYGTGAFAANAIPVPELSITNNLTFTLAVTSTGNIGATITANGILLSPQVITDDTTTPVTTTYGFLNVLDFLYGAVPGSTVNADTSKADVWTHNDREIEFRYKLYRSFQHEFSMFCGIPLGTRGGMSGSMAYKGGNISII